MHEVFVLGLDPIFLDIIVSPVDNQLNKISSLPQIGEHISNTIIKMIPGGNGLNFARILSKLNQNVIFFGSLNQFFLELVQNDSPNLHCIATTAQEPNMTVALQFKTGEIQMNSISHFFSISDLNFKSLFFLTFSKVVPFSNLGLNKKAIRLFDFLTSYFIDLESFLNNSHISDKLELVTTYISNIAKTNEDLIHLKIDSQELILSEINELRIDLTNKIFYFDPSTVTSFLDWAWLKIFFNKKFANLPGFKIISLNEHEYQLIESNGINFDEFLIINKNNFLIVHESTIITYFQNSIQNKGIIQVPYLNEDKIISSVGAGDAFNAGLVYRFSKTHDIFDACKYGITIAQKHLTGSF